MSEIIAFTHGHIGKQTAIRPAIQYLEPKPMDLVAHSFDMGKRVLSRRSHEQHKQFGQFLTFPTVARYMARQLGPLRDGDRILDPGIGSGVLACAVVERAIQANQPMELWIDGYEVDLQLVQAANEALTQATRRAAHHGITLHTSVYARDFIAESTLLKSLFGPNSSVTYDHIIANPPYFKLNTNDPRIQAVINHVRGYTNIYTLFIALSLQLLKSPSGQACFIVPRSFCSGAYFSAFRQDFLRQAVPVSVHLFKSRRSIFKHSNVLQENIVLSFRSLLSSQYGQEVRTERRFFQVDVSTSESDADLNDNVLSRKVSSVHFLSCRNGDLFFRLPASEMDEEIIKAVDLWEGSLHIYRLEASTGPVVPFRAREFLTDADAVESGQAFPLLWMQNVQPQRIEWPVARGNKPQGILRAVGKKLLVPLGNYVLLRRFSAKEGARRLIAVALIGDEFDCRYRQIGLENHLNYIRRQDGNLTAEEARGLAALLNCVLMDRYFRIANGNTQVNAAELRALPLPPLEVIRQIGQAVLACESTLDIDEVVFSVLREAGYLPSISYTAREIEVGSGSDTDLGRQRSSAS